MSNEDKTEIPRTKDHKPAVQPTDFWSWLTRTFYVLPGHPEFDADSSLVYTLDEGLLYYPTQDEQAVPIQVQAKWLLAYVTVWALLAYAGTGGTLGAYAVGFFTGLLIIVVESFFYSNITQVQVLKSPERPYITNVPLVSNVDKGEPLDKDLNHYLNFSSSGSGDYKILIDNTTLPQDGESGYIFPASTFLKKSSSGEFVTMDLIDYLEGKRLAGGPASARHKRFNPGRQDDVKFYSERVDRLSQAAYYTGIIIITWAMYATNSKWGSAKQLQWNILAFVVAVIAGGVVVDAYDVVMYNTIIYIKKRLLILAISLGITGILIV